MKDYSIHRSMGYCPIQISGENIISAISNNLKTIASTANIGNAAGYHINKMTAVYDSGILGGKGGCKLIIVATGQPLAHTRDAGDTKSTQIWIGGVTHEELPEKYDFKFKQS